MKIGKLPNEILQKRVIASLSRRRNEVLVGAGMGRDSAVLDLNNQYCVLSTDPITASGTNLGYLGVHIACNDIAASFGEPIGVLITLLAPPSASIEDIEQTMNEVEQATSELAIEVLGGHTEFTDAVNKMVLSVTAIGKTQHTGKIPTMSHPLAIIMTKSAGIEGTAILAKEYSKFLSPTVLN